VIALAVVVGLLVPTVIGGWAPVLHWTCQRGAQVLNRSARIPAQLLNSPFGGWVWGNVTTPPGLIERGTGISDILGSSYYNGGVVWNGFQANVSVFTLSNQTAWGPGDSTRCSEPFEVDLIASGNISTGIALVLPGNVSDQHEPTVLFPGYPNILSFQNGFSTPNMANVSTCGGPAWSSPRVVSSDLTLWANFSIGTQNHVQPFLVPLVTSVFHYWFPANFGTWQVDNLSAPGGPGGGWAFSYSPCS
jgi:hypothetical protein